MNTVTSNKEKKTTLKDVAERAGVSAAVVSRVINKDDSLSIRDETREAVFRAIKELEYMVPSSKNIHKKSNALVGLVMDNITNPFHAEIIKGLQAAAEDLAYSMVIYDTNNDPRKELKCINTMKALPVKGIILFSGFINSSTLSHLRDSNLPFVLVHRASSDPTVSLVQVDDLHGAELATNYLYQLGHRRIAHIAGPLHTDTALRRLEGYRRVLANNHIPYRAEYIVETTDFHNPHHGYDACQSFLSIPDKPTAIFTATDLLAMGALQAIHDAGLQVPQDISVIGYNDIWVSASTVPPLTTIKSPMFEMGKHALLMLDDIVQNKKLGHQSITLAPELVLRDTTASPANV